MRITGLPTTLTTALALASATAFTSVVTTAASAAAMTAPRQATTPVCVQDGIAALCASATPTQDVLAIKYQVTQLDGPGTYTVYYVSVGTGASSRPQTVGPLVYQQTATGTLNAGLTDCYDVHLDSTTGTRLTTGPVCD